MQLSLLLDALDEYREIGCPAEDLNIEALVHDSRRAGRAILFAALVGVTRDKNGRISDGHEYVAAAAAAGSPAALVQRPLADLPAICQVVTPNTRVALAKIAERFHHYPSRSLKMIGVTGTNGKTTVCHLLEAVLAAAGYHVGILGTVETRYGSVRRPASSTTPEPLELSATLAAMRDDRVNACVMEVSSHALSQHRVDGLSFDLALFTNLTRDHLDYHADLEDYFQAKRRLFSELLPRAASGGRTPKAVICTDNQYGRRLADELADGPCQLLTYGLDPGAMVTLDRGECSLDGGNCQVRHPQGTLEISLCLPGAYNQQNLLAAVAAGLALKLDPGAIKKGVEGLAGVPGRLQRVGRPGQWPAVFVDYAHTDDALTNVLGALKPITPGRLFCVFGAGGNRDHGKRPLMGAAVARGADLAVLTSDNPRDEEPGAIMAMVEPGLAGQGWSGVADLNGQAGGVYLKQPDRARAIKEAIAAAGPGDVVLIAGKGHETYQETAGVKRHFDDREEAAIALAHKGDRGHV